MTFKHSCHNDFQDRVLAHGVVMVAIRSQTVPRARMSVSPNSQSRTAPHSAIDPQLSFTALADFLAATSVNRIPEDSLAFYSAF
jgi:hypothetical protein